LLGTEKANNDLEVSIIIVNWNTKDLLYACLSSVFKHVTAKLKFEVIVIDNASEDGSGEMVQKEFPEVVLIFNSDNVGFARANNQGAAIAEGRYLLLLNSDTLVLDNSITQIIEHLDSHPDIGLATGRVLNHDMTFQRPFSRFPHYFDAFFHQTSRLIVGWNSPLYKRYHLEGLDEMQSHDVDWVSGAYLFVRNDLIDGGKVLDENIFMYYEDTLLCYQARQRGYRIVYLPYAPIIHYGGMSSSGIGKKAIYNSFKGSVAYFGKVHGATSARHYEVAVRGTWQFFAWVFGLLQVIPFSKFEKKAVMFSYLVERSATEQALRA
jgi:hypothetical protein